MSLLAIVYMRIFLKESIPAKMELMIHPILEQNISDDDDENGPKLATKNHLLTDISSLRDVIMSR